MSLCTFQLKSNFFLKFDLALMTVQFTLIVYFTLPKEIFTKGKTV